MYKIGVTGGIASGKSTAAAYLAELSKGRHIDADKIGHELLASDPAVIDRLIDAFGDQIRSEQEGIDRKKLGNLVFNDGQARSILNGIIHPEIGNEINRRLAEFEKQQVPWVFVEAALLLETGSHKKYDDLIIVLCSTEDQTKRLVENKGMSKEEAIKRINSQLSNTDRSKFNQYIIIYNDKDLVTFKGRLKSAFDALTLRLTGVS